MRVPHNRLTHLALCIRLQESDPDQTFASEEFCEMVLSRRRYASHIVGLNNIILQICTSDAGELAKQTLDNVSLVLSEEYAREDHYLCWGTFTFVTRYANDYFAQFLQLEKYGFR